MELVQVRRTPLEKPYDSLIEQYHYLEYTRPVGEHLEYVAFSYDRPIACLGWCSPPRHIGCRDRYIGWNQEQRGKRLHFVVINTRFLILPWVGIPHLASHLLGMMVRRISSDWERIYAHEVVILESYVAPEFYRQAAMIESKIKDVVQSPATHLAIRRIQDIFCKNEDHLYYWASDRRVPAENNLAERDLRPTVIERKVRFGSQSDAGAKTPEVMMIVLHTLKKRCVDPTGALKNILDQLAKDIKTDPFNLIYPANTS